MKKNSFVRKFGINLFKSISIQFILFISLVLHFSAQAELPGNLKDNKSIKNRVDTAIESKVDYLERIYFSGENKEGLNNLILATIQEFNGKEMNTAVAAQLMFLSGIKDKAEAAENSCDVSEIIAAGIFSLDVAEALKQGVSKPSTKVSVQLGPILSSSQNLGSSASSLAYNAFILSNGKINGLNTMSKLGSTANTIGSIGNTVAQSKVAVDQVKGLVKAFGIAKDKPCKGIAKKDIQISEHLIKNLANNTPGNPAQATTANIAVPGSNSTTSSGGTSVATGNVATASGTGSNPTTLSISGGDFGKIKTISDRLKSCAKVSDVKMNYDINNSVLNIFHEGSVENLLAVMLSACKGIITDKNITGMNEDKKMISLKL